MCLRKCIISYLSIEIKDFFLSVHYNELEAHVSAAPDCCCCAKGSIIVRFMFATECARVRVYN